MKAGKYALYLIYSLNDPDLYLKKVQQRNARLSAEMRRFIKNILSNASVRVPDDISDTGLIQAYWKVHVKAAPFEQISITETNIHFRKLSKADKTMGERVRNTLLNRVKNIKDRKPYFEMDSSIKDILDSGDTATVFEFKLIVQDPAGGKFPVYCQMWWSEQAQSWIPLSLVPAVARPIHIVF